MTTPTDRRGFHPAPVGTGSTLPRRRRICQSILNRIERGTIDVELLDGRRFRAIGG